MTAEAGHVPSLYVGPHDVNGVNPDYVNALAVHLISISRPAAR